MVVKFAQGETKIAQLQGAMEKLELKVKEKDREKELLAEKLRSMKSETAKRGSTLDERVNHRAKIYFIVLWVKQRSTVIRCEL